MKLFRTFTMVEVVIGIEMKELQKEMADALYWLRTLTTEVTCLHLFESVAEVEALSTERLNAWRIKMMMMDRIMTEDSKRKT